VGRAVGRVGRGPWAGPWAAWAVGRGQGRGPRGQGRGPRGQTTRHNRTNLSKFGFFKQKARTF